MELTIRELAVRVGMTPRNIREWQTIKLLPPPRRAGRTAFYDDGHVTRIERIKSLRADGFPLDVIRQVLSRSAESAADVQAVAAMLLDPASIERTRHVRREDLTARLGADAEDALVLGGLIEIVDDEQALIKDTATFDCVEGLFAIGLPADAVIGAFETLTELQVSGVGALVDLYSEVIWRPFVDAGLPTEQWQSIAVTSGQMRELIIAIGARALRRATDIAIGKVAVQQATKLDGSG